MKTLLLTPHTSAKGFGRISLVTKTIAVSAIVSVLGILAAQAASVFVPNGNFEDYADIGDGTTGAGWSSFPSAANDSITAALSIDDEFWSNPSSFGSGWTSTGPQPSNGKYGLQHPKKSSQQDMSAPFNGDFIGFMNLTEGDATGASVGAVESGVLGQLAAGTYSLTVAVGARPSSSWNDVTYTISLTSGGNALGTPSSVTLVPSTAVLGSNTQDLSYNLSLTSGDSLIGQDYAIRIGLANAGTKDGTPTDLSTFTQANFDNVRLDFTPVPEPTSFALAICGAFVLGAIGKFRRRS